MPLSPINSNFIKAKKSNKDSKPIQTSVSKINKDSFVKQNDKAIVCGTGVAFLGAFLGAFKEKFHPSKIPSSIETEFSGLKLIENEDKAIEKADHLFRSAMSKMLNSKELTAEEKALIDETEFITPQDIKFQESVRMFAEKMLKTEESGGRFFGCYKKYSPDSGLMGGLPWHLSNMERFRDILKNSGKYNDNDEYIDYINQRFFKEKTFRILTEKNGSIKPVAAEISKESIPKDVKLSDATYNFKEIINYLKNSKCDKDFATFYFMQECKDYNPIPKYIGKIIEQADNEFEQAKEQAYKSFQKRHLLKSVGIGSVVAGGLFFAGSFIYNKVKNNDKK